MNLDISASVLLRRKDIHVPRNGNGDKTHTVEISSIGSIFLICPVCQGFLFYPEHQTFIGALAGRSTFVQRNFRLGIVSA